MNININSFENMKKNITKVAYGSATTLEAIIVSPVFRIHREFNIFLYN